MAKNEAPIAVFDSGLGGISVLRELVKLMPEEHYLYYGDNANAPYGDRTTENVRALTLAAAEMLFDRGAKALVVACNTATAAAIEILRETSPNKIIVGIEPAVKLAADHRAGSIGVMATAVTLREEKLANLIHRFSDQEFFSICPPGLVPLIEAGASTEELIAYLEPVLSPYRGKLDAMVLGCTHYPFARDAISVILPGVKLVDGGAGTARQTQRLLAQADLLNRGEGKIQIENSAADPGFVLRAIAFLEEE